MKQALPAEITDLPARIMGQEIEYGGMVLNADGSWEGVYTGADSYARMRLKRLREEFYQVSEPNLMTPARINASDLWTPNGSRAYFDVGHIEIATPECKTARDVVVYARATELVIARAFFGREGELPIILLRDNSNSRDDICFAAHENYLALASRIRPNSRMFPEWFEEQFLTFLATRILFTGAGSVRYAGEWSRESGRYSMSFRARCTDKTIYMSATCMKPMIMNRDQPLSDNKQHFRLQLTVADPNVLEVAEYLKFGTTALVIRFLERFQETAQLPVTKMSALGVLHQVNFDTAMQHRYWLRDERKLGAVDIQRLFVDAIAEVFPADDDPAFVVAETNDILERWTRVLDGLSHDVDSVAQDVDWVLKRRLIDAALDADYNMSLSDLRRGFDEGEGNVDALYSAKAMELRYTEVRPEGLGYRLLNSGFANRITTDEEITKAILLPPGWDNVSRRTRAWPRGRLVKWLEENGISFLANRNWRDVKIMGDNRPEEMPEEVSFPDPFRWEYSDVERLYEA